MSSDNRVSVDSEFSFESNNIQVLRNLSNLMNQLKISSPSSEKKSLDINSISLADVQDLQFDKDVSDTLKLALIKSLIMKLMTISDASNNNDASTAYKNLISDLDEDINTKLNSLFLLQKPKVESDLPKSTSFHTLDPAKTSNSSSSLVAAIKAKPEPIAKTLSAPTTIATGTEQPAVNDQLPPRSAGISLDPLKKCDMLPESVPEKHDEQKESPFQYSSGSSDYAGESNGQPGTLSNISSNYSSRNNSKADLTSSNDNNQNTEPQSRNSSVYSQKSPTHLIADSISSSRLSNSPSATYNNNRIQLPSPRNDTAIDPASTVNTKDTAKEQLIRNSPSLRSYSGRTVPASQETRKFKAGNESTSNKINQANVAATNKALSPILLNRDADDVVGKQDSINPFSEKISQESSKVVDTRKNKSASLLLLDSENGKSGDEFDLEKEMEIERLKRNPNRFINKRASSDELRQKPQESYNIKGTEPPSRHIQSPSAKSTPIIGRSTPTMRNSPSMFSDSERTPKTYGMGIMGLESPVIVRRDMSPSSPRDQELKVPAYLKIANGSEIASGIADGPSRIQMSNYNNVNHARDRFYQGSKKQPQYSTYTNLTTQDKGHVKSPTLSSMSAAAALASSLQHGQPDTKKFSRSQPSTPQSPAFTDYNTIDIERTMDNDASLFIQPKDYNTISLKLITSLSANKTNSSSFDPTVVFAAIDKVSQKEIWRFKKSYSQMVKLDRDVRGAFESFLLPGLPDKSLFLNNLPAKIDSRRSGLLNYFSTLLNLPKLPRKVIYMVCKFVSTNTVNPLDDIEYNFSNEINEKDFKKQGYLVRKNKGLGSTWKVRYCKCEGPFLFVFDSIDGVLLDTIRLAGAQIGRQQSDTSTEESSSNSKGYRHALLLKEMKKNSIGSGTNKHIFCAESDEERDSWIDVLIEYVQDASTDYEPVELANNVSAISNSYSSSTLLSTPRHGHTRTKSADLSVSTSTNFVNSSTEAPSPSVSSPKYNDNSTLFGSEYDDSYREPKKSRKRFFGGIRNKLGNSNAGSGIASPNDLLDNTLASTNGEDFQMNAVTDLSNFTADSSFNANALNNNSNGNIHNNQTQVNGNHANILPDANMTPGYSTEYIFGNSLENAFSLSAAELDGKDVPSIIPRCLVYLKQTGAGYQEGIFRLSGSSTVIRHLKELFDSKLDVDLANMDVRPEINSVTGLLKLYLRELPENILTTEISTRLHSVLSDYNKNMASDSPQLNRIKVDDMNHSAYLTYMYQLKSLLRQLPQINQNVLYVLFKFLNEEVLLRSDYNKMNLRNLVIVFSATLNIESKILAEFFINFAFLFENGDMVNEPDRPNVDVGSIPLV